MFSTCNHGFQAPSPPVTACVAARYHDTRIALLRLDPKGAWKRYIQELKHEDMQGPYEEDTESKGVNFIPSWIWTVHAPPPPPDSTPPSNNLQTSGTTTVNPVSPATPDPDDEVRDEEVEEYVRVDWAKAQERTKCFEEEIALTVEDMRHTLVFFAWKVKEWECLTELRANATNKPTHSLHKRIL